MRFFRLPIQMALIARCKAIGVGAGLSAGYLLGWAFRFSNWELQSTIDQKFVENFNKLPYKTFCKNLFKVKNFSYTNGLKDRHKLIHFFQKIWDRAVDRLKNEVKFYALIF